MLGKKDQGCVIPETSPEETRYPVGIEAKLERDNKTQQASQSASSKRLSREWRLDQVGVSCDGENNQA